MSPSDEKVPGAYINLGNGEASGPVHATTFRRVPQVST